MKKTLLSLILLFSIHFLVAQAYVPFPSFHAGWKDVYNCTENNYFTAGDTTINQLIYHKVFVFGYDFNRNILTGNCSPFSKTPFPQRYAGAFRNDTANKKVYFVPPMAISDTLLYDFDLNLGDTLEPHYKLRDSSKSNLVSFWVSEIDSIQSGGIWRKRFKLTGGDSVITGIFNIDLIEGIGSTQSFLGPYTHYPYGNGDLECAKDSGLLIYGHTSCDLVVGIEFQVKPEAIAYKIYPNPANEEVLLQLEQKTKVQQIELYDLMGRQQLSIPGVTNKSTYRISIVDLPKGIYLVTLRLENGRTVTKRLVKQ